MTCYFALDCAQTLSLPLQVGQYIQHKGGVVTAEELAPFLDAPSGDLRQDGTTVDEGFVVPALVRFNGSPEVDASGNLLYRFPSLQRTRQSKVRMQGHHNSYWPIYVGSCDTSLGSSGRQRMHILGLYCYLVVSA
jgi:hypothetical protein